MVEVDVVDRLDRRPGVGVGGEQRPAGAGEQVHRLLEEFDPGHPGHPVIGEQHGDPIAAQLQLAQRFEGARTGLRAHHPVRVAVVAAEISGDGARHAGIVVNREQNRLAVIWRSTSRSVFSRHGSFDANTGLARTLAGCSPPPSIVG